MTIQLHIIILALVTVALIAITLIASVRFKRQWALRKGTRHPRYSLLECDPETLPSWWVRLFGRILSTILLAAFVSSLFPFNPAYWVLTQHEGTIASISNRFVEGSGDISGRTYTLTLKGDQTPRVVTDPRILGLEVGDWVDLTCSLEWVYGGADRSNCYMRSFGTPTGQAAR